MVKTMKRVLAFVLALVCIISVYQPSTAKAYRIPTLNKYSLTVYVGKTKTLKLKNATQSRVKWSSSKKSVATVTSKGKVKGKKPGTCKITAKYGNVKYTCNVTVAFSPSTIKKNVKVSYKYGDTVTLVYFKNTNKCMVSIDAQMAFFDANSSMTGSDKSSVYCLGAGRTAVAVFNNPSTSTSGYLRPDHVNLSINVKEVTYYKDAASKIKCSTSMGAEGVVVTSTNTSTKSLVSVIGTLIMYDASGEIITATTRYLDCEAAGFTSYKEFSYPYDYSAHCSVYPTSCKIVINEAYYRNY